MSDERTVLVPSNCEILSHASTEILHTYRNGEVLVRTAAPIDSTETLINSGVCLDSRLDGQTNRLLESSRSPLDAFSDRDIITAYLELIGPLDPDWLLILQQLEIELLQFQPEHSFLSRGSVQAFRQALKQYFVIGVVPISAETKPQPPAPESGEEEVWIVVQDQPDRTALIQELNSIPEVSIDPNQPIESVGFYLRLRGRVSAQGQAALLQHPHVLAVEPYSPVQPEDEVAGLILAGQYNSLGQPQGSYLRWLEDHGINGAGVTIGIVDAGVEANHPAFTGRIKQLNPDRKSWHGTFVAGHAAGCYLEEKDSNQFIYGLGMAPKAEILIQDNQSTPIALCRETVTEKSPSGQIGSIQNNSWGAGTKNPMDYGSQEATYDRLVRNADPDSAIAKPLNICFSAGNSGINGLTRPKAAKNIIVTGNSENYRPATGKEQSDSIDQLYQGPRGSSYGNCGDGRIAPHLVAPGEWTASANYDSNPGDREYISSQLTWGSGTSAASPKTAGACALLIQWWRQHHYNQDPSPALLKAMLVNGAEPLKAGGFIPNMQQGWGRLNLENVLRPDVQRIYIDQSIRLKQRGDNQTWKIRVANPNLPVKVTLCWTDPPGALGTGTSTASAIVNKLALRLEANGETYRGNQFQNGWSYQDGSRDREGWDNLQNIFLAPGTATGTLQVTVTALEITTNCLTGKIDIPQQDFALVISNATIETDQTSVFVSVDPNTNTQTKPKDSGDYWAGRNQDRQSVDYDWWQKIDNNTKPKPKPATQQQIEAWWMREDIGSSKPESDRALPPAIVESLEASITVVTADQSHQIVMANRTESESSRTNSSEGLVTMGGGKIAESTKDITSLLQYPVDLSRALLQLMQNWTQFGSLQQKQVAVLLVGAGTRVTADDLFALRRLAQLGQLYLISTDAQLLSFLVQRVHYSPNLFCRLAKDENALPTLLRDTIVEASGGQQCEIEMNSIVIENNWLSYYSFNVTHLDRHLTIRLQFPLQQALPKIALYRPGQETIELSSSISGIQVTSGEDFLQIDCDRSSISAGAWKLLLQQATPDDTYRIRVWAWTDLGISIDQKTLSVSDQELEFLMTVRGGEGITFHRLQGQPRLIQETTSSREVESDRFIEATAIAPREGQRQPESSRTVNAAELGTVIRVMPSQPGAIALDVPMWVEGTDPQGVQFTRLIRQSLLHLESRSQWRQRLVEAAELFFTSARMIGVEREAEAIVRLKLQRSDRTRWVSVTSPSLRTQLEWILKQSWSTQECLVGITGDELFGLYRALK
ncbi:S8 family serine peptidase [Cyanobacteria bacterium FACHB-DQ100]|nr:S8 family serine peptidase [Cyanobacteria bacterium FACHB-DQ100]